MIELWQIARIWLCDHGGSTFKTPFKWLQRFHSLSPTLPGTGMELGCSSSVPSHGCAGKDWGVREVRPSLIVKWWHLAICHHFTSWEYPQTKNLGSLKGESHKNYQKRSLMDSMSQTCSSLHSTHKLSQSAAANQVSNPMSKWDNQNQPKSCTVHVDPNMWPTDPQRTQCKE